MKSDEISSNPPSNSVDTEFGQHRRVKYQKVRDARKHPVRGLWRRNGRYYAQITIEDPNTGRKTVKRVPLEGATTDPQAISAYQELLAQRRKKTLPVLKRPPSFQEYAKDYLQFHRTVKDAKRASTLATEEVIIGQPSPLATSAQQVPRGRGGPEFPNSPGAPKFPTARQP